MRTGLLPLDLQVTDARGNWRSVNHFVHDHPVFEGLPVNCFMNEAYQNAIPRQMLLGIHAKPIAGGVTWTLDHNYRGVREVIDGADFAIVPHGTGKLILSKLRLVEHFGRDPVVDRIMYNLVSFAASQITSIEPVDEKVLQGDLDRYFARFESVTQ